MAKKPKRIPILNTNVLVNKKFKEKKLIRLSNLCKSYGSKIIIDDANYQFPTGESIALVGPNGVGKSTVLNIIAGIEEADSGEVIFPGNGVIAYLPQEPNLTPRDTVLLECQMGRDDLLNARIKMHQLLEEIEIQHDKNLLDQYEELEAKYKTAGGYTIESRAASILYGLGFDEKKMQQNPLELSGGWRMRLELAKLFLRDADFLILDEPTNHLDLPSLMWVENYLKKFTGTLLLVSHDRALLNRIPTYILHLHKGTLKGYKGNFDEFLEARQQQQEYEEASLEQLKKKREQLQHFVTRFGAKATKASQAQGKLKQIAKIEDQERELENDYSESSISFQLPIGKPGPKVPCIFSNGTIGYDQPLSRNIQLQVERGQKIAVIGANGIGKSTLIKALAGKLPPLLGEVKIPEGVELSYFSQDQLDTLDPEKTVLENLLRFSDLGEPAGRSLLGSFLFQSEDVFKPVKVLSGGEKGRLGLACVMSQQSNFLLLDEPTNHLDILSVETLTNALTQYQGTLIFVSHDREFINDVSTHIFAMLPDGRSRLFEGDLADYERLAEVGNFPNVLAPQEMKLHDSNTGNGNKELQNKNSDQLEYKELIKELRKIEKNLSLLDQSMNKFREGIEKQDKIILETDPNDFNKVTAIFNDKQNLESQLESAEEEWMEFSEAEHNILEKLDAMGRKPK